LATAIERYPGAPEYPQASLKYARLLEAAGRFEESNAIYTRLRESAPPAYRGGAISGLARQAERDGKTELARDLYKLAVKESAWGSEQWTEAADSLGALNVAAIFSSKPTSDSKVYRVEAGDNLTAIGMKLNTTQGLLMRANNISDPTTLRISQNLKYTPKDFHIVIERSTLRLFLMDNDGLFKVYKVGLGRPGQDTTLGRYRIGNKEKDPTWHKPGAGPIPPGDPRNELGTRWMPLIPEEEGLPNDLGIHGTIEPETVGKYTSMGCPRLLAAEVEELYDLIVRSTPVAIVEKFDPDVAL
jgi:lipoprotein-anchoring transpeptidase ErfK/SrfK